MSAAAPSPTVAPPKPTGLALTFAWRRVLVVLVASTLVGLLISPAFPTLSALRVVGREMFVGMCALVGFGLFEQWPKRLPDWLARWALQVCSVAFVIPFAVLFLYLLPTDDSRPFWHFEARRSGFFMITMTGLLFAPWISVAALFRQTEFAARSRELAFNLERSELERKALDAHLRLLQAQVEPHFLFNTLANVRELVVAGAPQAATVLDSLIAYLRAAVPRLQEPATTMDQELELVRAYLELMHMRMPDRLQFELQVDAAALPLHCPPTTLLTLVENAVRHGIDPSEEGGKIVVSVQVKDGRCRCEVSDTGSGLERVVGGLGTGLATLLERLQLVFGGDAHLNLVALHPQGARAELDFPAQAKPA
jgi:signal transduction histidine kinase